MKIKPVIKHKRGAPMRAQQNKRYILSQDNDCHWYVIPVLKLSAWDAWLNIPSDDERSWVPPDFADPVGGSPSLVTFENYQNPI